MCVCACDAGAVLVMLLVLLSMSVLMLMRPRCVLRLCLCRLCAPCSVQRHQSGPLLLTGGLLCVVRPLQSGGGRCVCCDP